MAGQRDKQIDGWWLVDRKKWIVGWIKIDGWLNGQEKNIWMLGWI